MGGAGAAPRRAEQPGDRGAARDQPRARPWWASALAPAGLLWGKTKALLPAPLSGAALVVSGGLVVATLAGLGLVAFLLVRDGGGGQAQQVGGLRDALLAGQPVEFESCRDEPTWVQPPFNDVFSDPVLESLSREEALRFYRQHVYQVQPGESANRLITVASGEATSRREAGGGECLASEPPDVYPVGSIAAYTLVYFEPVAVLRNDNILAVTLSPRETGISTLDVPLGESMPTDLWSFFVDEGGQLIAVCSAIGCERADLLPVQPPRRTGVPEVDTVIDALFSGDREAVLSLIRYQTSNASQK